MRVATAMGMAFEVPRGVWWSFYNSPYPAHRNGTAIDVYFQGEALFPMEEGTVALVRKVRTPAHVPAREDYLILIRTGEFYLKVLHVAPKVKIGERLSREDPIGEMIVSGFFRPWSNKHAHFELRPINDPVRARGAFEVVPEVRNLVPVIRGDELEIVECCEAYCWARPVKSRGRGLTPLAYEGISVEGGVPYYHYAAAFGTLEEVEIFGTRLRASTILKNSTTIFKTPIHVTANSRRIRGIGVYCNNPLIKVVGKFEDGDVLRLTSHLWEDTSKHN